MTRQGKPAAIDSRTGRRLQLFALATAGCILLAVRYLEERDLIAAHGECREYRR